MRNGETIAIRLFSGCTVKGHGCFLPIHFSQNGFYDNLIFSLILIPYTYLEKWVRVSRGHSQALLRSQCGKMDSKIAQKWNRQKITYLFLGQPQLRTSWLFHFESLTEREEIFARLLWTPIAKLVHIFRFCWSSTTDVDCGYVDEMSCHGSHLNTEGLKLVLMAGTNEKTMSQCLKTAGGLINSDILLLR